MKKNAMQEQENRRVARKFMSFSFIYSMLFNRLSEAELQEYHKIMNFYDEGCIVNIEINLEQKGSFFVDYKMLCVFYEEIQKRIPEDYYCMTGPLVSHRIILFFSREIGKENVTEKLRKELREIAENIGQMLIDIGSFTVSIGIGSWRPIAEIGISYDEALRSVRYEPSSMVSMIEDLGDYLPAIQEYDELKKKFLASIRVGEEISLIYLTQIMEMISGLKLDGQKNLLLELLVLSVSEVYETLDSKEEDYLDFIGYAVELSSVKKEELHNWTYNKFLYVTKLAERILSKIR